MIVCNGSVYSHINSLPEAKLNGLINNGVSIEETIRVEAGKLKFWELHYFRMMASMRILRMGIPMNFTMEYLEEQIHSVLNSNNLSSDSSLVSLSFFSADQPTRENSIVSTSFLIKAKASSIPSTLKIGTRSIELYKDHWITKGLYGTLESSNKRLRTLASVFAFENNFEDLILINEDKQVTETLEGAIFSVKGDQIKTAPITSGCRSSVYRQLIIDIIEKTDGMDFEEGPISPFDLQKSDELFVVSVEHGIKSVKQYRKKIFTPSKAEFLFSKFITSYRLS
ncbi:aminotransferase class IV [Flavobacteriaceae bacterium]|nr:aminotransferase class IV [Flavobacteriaceae bacterium]